MTYLTDQELLMLGYAAEASGPKDDQTMERIIAWAEQVRAEGAVLDLATKGMVILDWDHVSGRVHYKADQSAVRGKDDA